MDDKAIEIRIVRGWEDSMLWCPSQCYLYFYVEKGDKKDFYMIYLRWRHEDPWTGDLFKTDEKGNEIAGSRIELESAYDFGEASSLDSLKSAVLEEAKQVILESGI